MEHQSVFFLAHHMRYKGGQTIQQVQQLDEDIIDKSTYSLSDYNSIYSILNKDQINHNNNHTMSQSLATNILYLAYRLRFAFEARVRQKDICDLKIKHTPKNTNSTIKNNILSPDQQFNLYLYMFNENSSVLIKDNHKYKSRFRNLYNIALDVMKI
jgi:hypothetical protein